jgi:prophage regulatory protein
MGTQEIQNLLKVSRTRARQITRERTFPEPYQRLAAGSIWLRSDVERWVKKHRRPRPVATDEDEPG